MTESEKGALKFVRDCVTDGVPPEAIDMKFLCSIKATRAVGYGSAQMQEVVTQGLLQLLPMVDEEGRNNILRRRAALLVGQANVDSIVKPYDQADVPDDQTWAATVENNALRTLGGDVIITPKQDHMIHFQVHFQDVQLHIQQVQNGQSDNMQLLIHLEQAGPHMNAHLGHMMGDPTRKDAVAQMRQSLVALSKMADQIKQQIANDPSAQVNQPAQGQQDPEAQAAMAKVQGDLALKAAKNQGDMALKTQKQQQQMKLKDLQASQQIKLKDLQAAHAMRLKNATAIQEIPIPVPTPAINPSPITAPYASPGLAQQTPKEAMPVTSET